jgi:hypothetical protein
MTKKRKRNDFTDLNNTLVGIYTDYRNCVLNRIYNSKQLASVSARNKWYEGAILTGSSSSGVAGFALWKTTEGQYVWGVLAALSILLTTWKPVLRYAQRIQRYTRLSTEYATLSISFYQIITDINSSRARISKVRELPRRVMSAVRELRNKIAELEPQGDGDPEPAYRATLVDEVNRRVPKEGLWLAGEKERTEDEDGN